MPNGASPQPTANFLILCFNWMQIQLVNSIPCLYKNYKQVILHSFCLLWNVDSLASHFHQIFCSYTGAAGPRLFTIHQIDASTNNLPKAHTW